MWICDNVRMKINEDKNNSCPECGGDCKRKGSFKNRNGITQRYQCLVCGKTFSDKQPLEGIRTDLDKAAQIVAMLCEGIGIRAASRLSGVTQKTVLNILEMAGQKAERLLDAKVRGIQPKHVEIDEVYGFVGCLQKNVRDENDPRGEQYAHLAIDGDTKLILHVHIGRRTLFDARDFMEGLKAKIDGRFQLTTDGYQGYTAPCGGVKLVFGNQVDYATEIKTYGPAIAEGPRRFNPIICKEVKRTPRFGFPNLSITTTNHAERMNLSVRLFNKRFARKTLGYSKKLQNHKYAMLLQVAHFNFCRKHSAHGTTPAMAAGITDHIWTAKELIEA
jgi:transposase-like protein/IS1 family transposase